MNRQEWLKARKLGIGSSDAPAVCGLSPFTTALEVYLDKIGQREPSENAYMRWGTKLQPIIAEAYQEQTGRTLEAPPCLLQHEDHKFMLASLDYQTMGDLRIVECKSTDKSQAKEWGEPGTDDIPEHYMVQVQHQLAVADRPIADVAVLIGGNDFRIYTVERNERLIALLIQREAGFWAHVQQRRPPAPDWAHASTPDLIGAMYAPNPGLTVRLDEEAGIMLTAYQEAAAEIKDADTHRDELKARLIELMGHAAVAELPDGRRITRTERRRKAYSVSESTYTDFRIKEPKKESVPS